MRIVARVVARPGKEEEVRAILCGLIQPSKDERGCLSYTLLQNQIDPTDFTLVETWRDAADFDAHLETPHFKRAASEITELVVEPLDIRRYHVVT